MCLSIKPRSEFFSQPQLEILGINVASTTKSRLASIPQLRVDLPPFHGGASTAVEDFRSSELFHTGGFITFLSPLNEISPKIIFFFSRLLYF